LPYYSPIKVIPSTKVTLLNASDDDARAVEEFAAEVLILEDM
jgi:hypothetical protein